MKVYRLPSLVSTDPDNVNTADNDALSDELNGCPVNSIFRGLPPNDPIHVLVRVYVVKVTGFSAALDTGPMCQFV